MCGIVGITGRQEVVGILLEGLRRLEYRGYDSAGIAVIDRGGLMVHKREGKIRDLEADLPWDRLQGTCGIAHTRWATHGEPNRVNAHPHLDTAGRVAVVHNGIIENFAALRVQLQKRGRVFLSDTDTEVLAHLISDFYRGNLEQAVQRALKLCEGTYGIAVMHADEPGKIVGARRGIAAGRGGRDGDELPGLRRGGDPRPHPPGDLPGRRRDGRPDAATRASRPRSTTARSPRRSRRSPGIWSRSRRAASRTSCSRRSSSSRRRSENAFRGRILPEAGDVKLGGLSLTDWELRNIRRIIILACGTSWHAGLVGEYLHRGVRAHPGRGGVRVGVPLPLADHRAGHALLAISQSGETIDTLEAMREAKRKGAKVLGIGTWSARRSPARSDGGVYIHAGPEIGVASTKAFTSQVTVLTLLTILLGRRAHYQHRLRHAHHPRTAGDPRQGAAASSRPRDSIREIAQAYKDHNNFLYLGRGYNFPIALEGALKLKEISYIHAEGYPAAEMKHGPIALIDPQMPVVVICTRDGSYEKIRATCRRCGRARARSSPS